MKILIVAATEPEISFLKNSLSASQLMQIDFLTTGVGMINTTYELTNTLLNVKYDLVLNVGIAGSFNRDILIGDVVWVKKELFSEMGAENDEEFLSLIQLGLQKHDEFPFEWSELKAKTLSEYHTLSALKQVNAITVNKVHGNEKSILQIKMRVNPDIESMEGAAVFYVCLKQNIPFVQIRSISNYVEKRNRDAWNIPLALRNLHEVSVKFLNELLPETNI